MESSVSNCPVPLEQQPIQQYEELQNSCFSGWARLEMPKYLRNLAWVWGISSLAVSPLAGASFPPHKHLGEFLLYSLLGGEILLGLVLLRLYLGWYYVRNRLNQESIVYEESGWYDGQSWTKTPEILARDRLIASYEIQPILKRLQQTGLILAISFVVGTGIAIAL